MICTKIFCGCWILPQLSHFGRSTLYKIDQLEYEHILKSTNISKMHREHSAKSCTVKKHMWQAENRNKREVAMGELCTMSTEKNHPNYLIAAQQSGSKEYDKTAIRTKKKLILFF